MIRACSRLNVTSRSLHLMSKCRASLELFFAIWFVMGNVWVFDSRLGSFRRAPKLHLLCISLLAWNAISYSFPFLLFLLLCCFVPIISSLLGYNINTGSIDRGASDDQISKLPSWRYKEADRSSLEPGNSMERSSDDPVSLSMSTGLQGLKSSKTRLMDCPYVLLSGVLHMPREVPGEGGSETIAMLAYVSPEVRGSVAQDHILLPSV